MPKAAGEALKIAVIGAGWAGLAAAIRVTERGDLATVFEASKSIGGRAKAANFSLPDGSPVTLDNGQHILIGAYSDTLRLMRRVGVEPSQVLRDLPMSLKFPDGRGIVFPNWPTPLDALGGILRAQGWSVGDKWSLLKAATRWQWQGFECEATQTVAELCQALTGRVKAELIEPLCVSALNTPAAQASASVFLRVLRDALFGVAGGSHLLLPTTDLGALFPESAATLLAQAGSAIWLSSRVDCLKQGKTGWLVNDKPFDAVILATSASNSTQVLVKSSQYATESVALKMQVWSRITQALRFEAIATVYAFGANASLSQPMLALRSTATEPAQFVFDRGQLAGPRGLLAFVVSASQGDRTTVENRVLRQARTQLGLTLQAVQTVVEKRATFACTPSLRRPPPWIAPGLMACGDYLAGPYPATLEGAVRSGLATADACVSAGSKAGGFQ